MTAAIDRRYMALALSLGRRGLGRVWPNPAVGCVIVNNGVIVGRGHTANGGRPHAEVIALAQAGQAAQGATAYVTLEPCAHHGQTGPCAAALVAAGITRCVVATTDPDPRVSGKGLAILQAAGIAVEIGVLEDKAATDHAGFFNRITRSKPFVTLKLATTLDGRIATATGDSQWITGPAARRIVHAMRARHDAVMIGAGTARADDPKLSVRDIGVQSQPVRIVVSRDLNLPDDSNLMRTANDQPIWLCHGPDAVTQKWVSLGAETLGCDVTHGQIDPASLMNVLAKQGLTRVLCEGGGALAASLIKSGVVDELVIFRGGVMTGADGLPSLAGIGVTTLSDGPRFALCNVRQIGTDTMEIWHPL